MRSEIQTHVPDSLIHHRNFVLKNALMEKSELPSEIEATISQFRTNGDMFKHAKSRAQELFDTKREAVEALINNDTSLVETGFRNSEMSQKHWNWLYRMMEKERDADGMQNVWEKAPEGDFKESLSVQERLANAFLYKAFNLYKKHNKTEAIQYADKSIDIVVGLQKKKDLSSRIDKIWGNYYLFGSQVYSDQGNSDEAVKALAEAAKHFEEGFIKDFDTSIGLRLIKTKMKYAIEKGDKRALADGFQIVKVVEMCANRDGGRWSNKTPDLLNLLEVSILNGKDFEFIASVYNKLNDKSRDNDDVKTESKLEEISEILSKIGSVDDKYKTRAKKATEHIEIILKSRKELFRPSTKHPEYQLRERDTQDLFDSGVQFKHLYPIWMSGNHKRGLILTPIMVGDKDREYVRGKLNEWGADKIDDPRIVDRLLSAKIIDQYQPNGMERPGSKEEQHHKKRILNLMDLTQVHKDWDATTNISVYYMLGLGDCRQISISYEHFRDVWWKDRINSNLHSAMKSRRHHDSFEKNLNKANKLLRRQSLLLNFYGVSKLKKERGLLKKYIHDSEEYFVKRNGEPIEVEKHTMPVELILDNNLVIRKVHFNDPLGHAHRLDGKKSGKYSKGYTPTQIVNGNINVGDLTVWESQKKKLVKTPIIYSLDNEVIAKQRIDPEMTDYGDLYLMGIPLSGIR